MSSLKINKNFFIELIINYTSKITMKAPNPNRAGDLLYNHNVLLIFFPVNTFVYHIVEMWLLNFVSGKLDLRLNSIIL